MKKRRLAGAISTILLIALSISGCATDLKDAEPNKMMAGDSYSSGWLGVEVAFKTKGLSARHTIVAVAKGTPASMTGLKVGDEIYFIGSDNTGYMNTPEVAKRLREADPHVVLKVKRNGHKDLLSFIVAKNNANLSKRMKPRTGSETGVNSAQPQKQSRDNRTNLDKLASKRNRLRQQVSGQILATVDTSGISITDQFKISGVPTRDQKAAGINELQRIYLDPATGRLAFAGTYDGAYATGSIDYSALLNDALHSPAPVFSLEPTPETIKAISRFVIDLDQQMEKNLASVSAGKAWLMRIFDLLLYDPDLGADRLRFLQKGADMLKVTPAEMPEMTQAMLGRVPQGSPPFIKFTSKYYESAGNPQFAFFIKAADKKDVDQDSFLAAIDWLGLEPLRQELRAKVESGALTTPRGEFLFEVGIWKKNYQIMKVPESKWKNAVARVEATFNAAAFRKVVDEVNAELMREKLLDPWLNGLVFSEQFLQRMYHMPTLETEPVYKEGLSPDSELARIFLEADWNLKNLTGLPELAKQVPEHLTPHQFLFQRETAAGQYDTGGIEFRLWLKPESMPLAYDSSKRILAFQTPIVSINAELLTRHGGSPSTATMTQNGLNDYGKMMTRKYDSYAKTLPALHRLREAAKLLAFVNWARAQGIRLKPPELPAPPIALPEKFKRGFWTAHFFADQNKTFIGLAASGGVDFSQNVGNGWIQASEDSALGKTAMGQLAGSAVLGQEAVDAALNGDLDAARALAEQSAQAMTGNFDFTGHPALGKIPEVPQPEPVLDVQLQTETLKLTKKAVDTLAHSSDSEQKAQATLQLQQIQKIMTTPSRAPEQIHAWVKVLKNGDWNSLSPQIAQSEPKKQDMPPVKRPQKDKLIEATAIEKERIRGEITVLRQDLCRIQSQLGRFNATIQADRAQRDEWEKTVDDAYTSALNRAKEKLADFALDFPEEKLQKILDTISDPTERMKVLNSLKMVQHLKEAYRVKDFSVWAANENYGPEEIKEGIDQISKTIGLEKKIKDYLSKRWGLGRVIAFQEAASDLVTSAYDVTAEVVAWQRLAQLNRNSDAFLAAIEKISRYQREVLSKIREREIRLGLNPGETKEPCR